MGGDKDLPELPSGWEAGIGERSKGYYYTKFFYYDGEEGEYELRIEWDKGHDHSVILRDSEKDTIVDSAHYDSEMEAEYGAVEMMKEHTGW